MSKYNTVDKINVLYLQEAGFIKVNIAKRMVGLLSALAVLLSAMSLVSCTRKKSEDGNDLADGARRLGLGIHAYMGGSVNASEDSDGAGNVVETVAAVFFDGDGKVISCRFDCAEIPLRFSYDGRYIFEDELETKREMGSAYGMSSAGAKLEWYEQADAFEKVCKGKTLKEIRSLSENGKSSDEVINAGCTIDVSDFILAIEKAAKDAVVAESSESDVLTLAVSTETNGVDASKDTAGYSSAESTFAAVLTNSNGIVSACRIDCVDSKVSFSIDGTAENPVSSSLKSKRQLGKDYGMKKSGAKYEWYEQADKFENSCIGKTLAGIISLQVGDYGNEEVQKAGCTVKVSGMIMAMVKALGGTSV